MELVYLVVNTEVILCIQFSKLQWGHVWSISHLKSLLSRIMNHSSHNPFVPHELLLLVTAAQGNASHCGASMHMHAQGHHAANSGSLHLHSPAYKLTGVSSGVRTTLGFISRYGKLIKLVLLDSTLEKLIVVEEECFDSRYECLAEVDFDSV